jgi:glutamate carboxypeptidase
VAKTPSSTLSPYVADFTARRDDIVQTIRELVQIESPSDHKPGIDRLAATLAARIQKIGGRVQIHEQKDSGNHLQADFSGRSGKPILLLGHLDTVYSLGTLSQMPCKLEDGKLWGPGVFDMKAGIAFMLHAIAAVQARHGGLPRPVTVLLVSDEEIGSDSSRTITETVAKKSEAVLVLEPSAGPRGTLKTARKGVGSYTVKVVGRAAHAGLDPGKGQSAIVELAHQIARIAKFTDLKRGMTVNVGVISGGTRVNVVPAEACAEVDARVARLADAKIIERKMRSLKPVNRKCKLEISGGLNRPPMERTAGVAALFARAQALGREIGWKIEETAVGGGSDGNFTSALGIPTLDGLGAVGEGAHATHESIVVEAIPRRAALIAALLETV